MRVETLTLGIVAAVTSAMALCFWRASAGLTRKLAALTARCEGAISDKAALPNEVSALENEDNGRISRLEHDLRSPLGVIRGFSMLLREFVDNNAQELPEFPLRAVNGIDQAAQRMLQIIEAAAGEPAPRDRKQALVPGENQHR